MAKKHATAMLVALVLVVAVASASASASVSTQQCDEGQLVVCAPAFLSGTPPVLSCCPNLNAQQPCFCQYSRDPALSIYFNSPYARSTLAACGIAYPNCY